MLCRTCQASQQLNYPSVGTNVGIHTGPDVSFASWDTGPFGSKSFRRTRWLYTTEAAVLTRVRRCQNSVIGSSPVSVGNLNSDSSRVINPMQEDRNAVVLKKFVDCSTRPSKVAIVVED